MSDFKFQLLTMADLESMPLTSRAHDFRETIDEAVAAMEPVKIRGDQLGRMFWRGRQWAVTEHGLEALDGTYYIAKDRLAEKARDKPELPDWPMHVCLKNWVDAPDFITAYLIALIVHGHASKFNRKALREHLAFSNGQTP